MSYTEFYVTKGSSAADINGGGPSLGTNDAPVDAVTDASATHDGSGSHTVTSSAQFVNAAVEDFVCWDADSAPVYGVITAKASSSSVTILSMSGAAFGVLTPSKVNVGGAFATIQHGVDTIATVSSSFVNSAGDPPSLNIGPGTWDEGQIDVDLGWSEALPLTIEGYNSTAHDLSTTQPLIDGSTTGGDVATLYLNASNIILRNVHVNSDVNSDQAIRVNANKVWVDRCTVDQGSTGAGANAIDIQLGECVISRCYIVNANRGVGIYCSAQGPIIFGNYVADSNGHGIHANRNTSVINNIVASAGSDGIGNVGYRCAVIGNTVSAGGDGIGLTGDTPAAVFNNILYNNTAYGIQQSASEWYACDFNAFGSNGTSDYENMKAAFQGVADVTLSGDPFTNAASGDFSLDASGKTDVGAKGFPGTMVDGTNVGYMDIGALQHESGAGGGGGAPGNMSGGLQ